MSNTGKYYEKFSSDPAYAQFKQFYKQPVSTVVTVIGTTGIEDPSVEDITITVNVTGSTFAPAFADLTAATYTCKSNAYQDGMGRTGIRADLQQLHLRRAPAIM